MNSESDEISDNMAAILCEHVAAKTHPALYAARTEPEDVADSGWQFMCNVHTDENPEEAKVWAINEVVQLDPSIKGWLNHPVGTQVVRADENSPWQEVERLTS